MLILVGAIGAVTRLIASQIQDKDRDPAVLVLDPEGRWVVPLLGGHYAGAEQLARELAADLGGEAVITGACFSDQRLALDSVGYGWGWRRGGSTQAWRELMQLQARGQIATYRQSAGPRHWNNSCRTTTPEPARSEQVDLSIGPEANATCRWHPANLWIGIGCERNSSENLVLRAIKQSLTEADLAMEAVAGIASADRKADEPALIQLVRTQQWPFRVFRCDALASQTVPTPSDVVRAEMGTASVAEAAALLAAGDKATLRLTKRIYHAQMGEQGAVTIAIAEASHAFAPARGELHLVGSGPGDLSLLSLDAQGALARCVAWVGYGLYLDLLEPLRRPDQVRFDGRLTQEWERCAEALALAQQGAKVALISSGDSGIYGMAGLALDLWLQQVEQDRPSFSVHPGISAIQLAAARAGAPLMHDFCTISLSDRLTPWTVIQQRLDAAAAGDFVVGLYNPRSKDRDWQLKHAQEILLKHRAQSTPVLIARQLGRLEEDIELTTLAALKPDDVDMLTLILIGNSTTFIRDGRMVTPRGYPGAKLS